MTTTTEVTVWCDAVGCSKWTYGGSSNHTATTARRGAKAEGWTRRDGADYCPAHSDPQPVRK